MKKHSCTTHPFVYASLGAGAFSDGYSISIEKDDPSVYAVIKAGGYMYRETSITAQYPKPAGELFIAYVWLHTHTHTHTYIYTFA